MTGRYKIAERCIEVRSIYGAVHGLCRDYKCDGVPVLTVRTAPGDIDYERKCSAAEDIAVGRPVREFPDSYLETLAVYRKMADGLLEYDTLLFQGSCIAVDGVAYLFTAKSGTGKSTHTALWREYFGERAVMVNDDKPLIRVTEQGATVYGTPWRGKHELGENISAPLSAICVLERAENNSIRPVTAREIYPMLLQQTHRPADPAKMVKTLTLIDRLGAAVGLYRLGCNMQIQAAKVAYEGMVNDK